MRMWEIRENSEYPEKKVSSDKYEEAYQEGYEDGYTKAMREIYFRDKKTR